MLSTLEKLRNAKRWNWDSPEAIREINELRDLLEEVFQAYTDQCAMDPDKALCAKVEAKTPLTKRSK